MSKAKQWTVRIALICIVLGCAIFLIAFAGTGFDLSQLNTMKFKTNTYDVNESFSHIRVEGAECDIRIVPSPTDMCRVVCTEGDKIFHTVTVRDDTLTVTRTDQRRWYEHIGIYWGAMAITLELPARAYGKLELQSASGAITVPDGFTFSQAEIKTASGEIDYAAATDRGLTLKTVSGDLTAGGVTAEYLDARSTSGDVSIHSVETQGDLSVQTVSGEIELENANAQDASVSSTSGSIALTRVRTAAQMNIHAVSGDVKLTDTVAAGPMDVETVSGDITLEHSDAQILWIKSTSGDVSGSLLTDKWFLTHTTSGDVRLPNSSSQAGTCEITTTSGDIHVQIVN